MSNIYIIADLHFGHKNLANNLRGFESIDDHDLHIITEWNKIVNKRDTVYILGDIAMNKKHYHLLNELKGFKKVILGNHDRAQDVQYLLKYVNSVCGSKSFHHAWLTHIPVHPSEFENERCELNIHGHLHEKQIQDCRYVNVSAEYINYKPILINDLLWKN